MAVQWAFTFGILGNIVSFLVYLAPLPTFIRIFKEKSTMGFDSLPYVVALFSSMLWMYYAFLKKNAFLLITINSFGCFIETIYILLYLFYASKRAKTRTVKLVGLMNMGLFCGIFMLTFFKFDGHIRIQVVGWICVVISVCVFVAPLSIVFQVVRTRSVEFMPFTLSFFLTLSAVMWFAYGLFQRDICIAIPNILGFFLGMIQMVLYAIFRNKKKKEIIIKEEEKMAEQQVINVTILGTPEKSCGDSKIEAINELEESSNNYVPCALSVEPSQVNLQQLESPVLVVCAAA